MVLRGRSALALAGRAAKSSCPFCSPAYEIISVLFRAGTVTPCDLGYCGIIAPLNALCLKARRKKLVFLVTGASHTRLSSSFLSKCGLWKASSSPVVTVTAAGPGDVQCWESLQSPLSAPGPAAPGSGSALYHPPLKIVQIWVSLLMCTCRISLSPD